jgi:VCPO second helical-bundle domain
MRTRALRAAIVLTACVVAAVAAMARDASAVLPAGNTVQQWDQIAQQTVIASGAFQNEGLVYMAYVSSAVYDAVISIEGQHKTLGPRIEARRGASQEAASIESAYQTLRYYFPAQQGALDALHTEALGAIPDGPAKLWGIAVGATAAGDVISARAGDGRVTPIASTSPFAPTAAPGVWRRTPPAFAPPQTPWVGSVRPFVLKQADQFLPDPPPPLQSKQWQDEFDEIKSLGRDTSTTRTPEQTDIARFWSANVIAQYNQAARDVATARGLDLAATARLMAMVNVVGADAQIAVMNAKYHYAFWRPVTAIDPTAVSAADGGRVPGFDDGNAATVEQPAWRPLLLTPNHPEYPAAHGSLTSAMAEVFRDFLGTSRIDLTLTSTTVPAMPTRYFEWVNDLRTEIVNARLWGGLHYRGSSLAGVELGRKVAKYDLAHAFGRAGNG